MSNAYPLRLDLNDLHVKLVTEYGVPLAISTDTHVTNQYDFMAYGVSIARLGWWRRRTCSIRCLMNCLSND